MANINLLNDLKSPKTARKQGWLAKLWGSSPKSEKPSKTPKVHRPLPKMVALALFLLPILGLVWVDQMLQEEMQSAVQKIAHKLQSEEKKFETEWQSPPDIDAWKKKIETIQLGMAELSRASSLSVQVATEYMDQLSKTLPSDVWIKQFSVYQSPGTTSPQFEIEGYAFTSETVLFFLNSLKDQHLFRSAWLSASEPTQENGLQEHKFLFRSKSLRGSDEE
jgi:Tfp pilus assembly protein PilN